MRAYDVILKKRDGGVLTPEEIEFMVSGYAAGTIPDSQMAAFLMSVYFQGLCSEETASLTSAMVRTGETLDLSSIPGRKVDKHSTGGVGDKTTLVLVPVLAAAELPIVKMSGRSLGHTGGTLDKLESIPGFRVELTPGEMVDQVMRIGAAVAGQTERLAPADKKMYALRDMTATVESIPLIAASVMSKKIAAGADAIVLDVKVGSGAFMKRVADAMALASAMLKIGRELGRETVAVITDMNQPLGQTVGNALEVREAIETLKGHGPPDLVQLCTILGGLALRLGRKVETQAEGETLAGDMLASGRGAEKLSEIIAAQGGNAAVVEDTSLLPQAVLVRDLRSERSGYVRKLDALKIAEAITALGGHRGESGASPDPAVGVHLFRKMGDRVTKGEVLAQVHANDEQSGRAGIELMREAYAFGAEPPSPRKLIHAVMG